MLKCKNYLYVKGKEARNVDGVLENCTGTALRGDAKVLSAT
jgi:hypothetical protein